MLRSRVIPSFAYLAAFSEEHVAKLFATLLSS